MSDFESLQSILSALTKKYGDDVIIRGSQVIEAIPRITTGVLAYDLMLGGGWPVNQWSEIIGEESSGKTALAYKTIAANQALDPDNWVQLAAIKPPVQLSAVTILSLRAINT